MDALSAEALRCIAEFGAQESSNMSWAFAKISMLPEQLMDAISA